MTPWLSFLLVMIAPVSSLKYEFLVKTDNAVAELNHFWASTGFWYVQKHFERVPTCTIVLNVYFVLYKFSIIKGKVQTLAIVKVN